MKKIKIAICSLTYKPYKGGLIRYLESLYHNLTVEHDVNIIVTEKKENLNQDYTDVKKIKYNNKIPLISMLYSLKKYLEKTEYDYYIIRHLYFAFIIALLPSINRKSMYIAPLLSFKLEKKNTIKSYAIYFLLYYIEKFTLKNIKNLGVLSTSKKNEIQYFTKRNDISVIKPGIDKKFKYKNKDRSSNQKICTVCRLSQEKNIEKIIELAEILTNYQFDIYGDGEESYKILLKKYCTNKQLENINFCGHVDDIEKIYSNYSYFMLLSKYEGFGHVFIESLASGTPVIGFSEKVPNTISACDEIINSSNGILLMSEDTNYIAKEINRYESVKWNHELISRNTISMYSWSQHFESIRNIINND